MSPTDPDECCPRFVPGPWDDKELQWQGKRFVKDRVTSVLHIPLNYGAVMKRVIGLVEAAGAIPESPVVLTDENSLWGADIYVEVTNDVPGAEMAEISGRFLSKVFEGPYGRMRTWMRDMEVFVQGKGLSAKRFYFYYTTCPKCAKKYGENYVVILAEV